jgi:hypothetical protein
MRIILDDDEVSSDEDEPLQKRLRQLSGVGLAVRDEAAVADKEAVDKWVVEEAAMKRAAEERATEEAAMKRAAEERATEEAAEPGWQCVMRWPRLTRRPQTSGPRRRQR